MTIMHTWRTDAGQTLTVNGDKFPELVAEMNASMMVPCQTSENYMVRIARLILEMYGETIPTTDERDFVLALKALGIVELIA